MPAQLEHANLTVSNPAATALWMQKVFGWHIRWQGEVSTGGHTIHVGTEDQYLALYGPLDELAKRAPDPFEVGGLNHLAVVVEDFTATEARVRAEGFVTGEHHTYEPGRRFYFHDGDGIEYEVVTYD